MPKENTSITNRAHDASSTLTLYMREDEYMSRLGHLVACV